VFQEIHGDTFDLPSQNESRKKQTQPIRLTLPVIRITAMIADTASKAGTTNGQLTILTTRTTHMTKACG